MPQSSAILGRMRQHYLSGGPAVDFYDVREAIGPSNPCEGDLAFYLRQARRTGSPILELGCGTGRISLPLAQAGFDVIGLDQSPSMLLVAREKAKRSPRPVRFVRGNMARFQLRRRFRLVLIPYRAFQHLLTPTDQRRCLRCVHRHLAREGRLVVHLFDPRLEFCFPGSPNPANARSTAHDPRSNRSVEVVVTDRRLDPLTQTFPSGGTGPSETRWAR